MYLDFALKAGSIEQGVKSGEQAVGARFIALVMVPGIMDHERFVRGTNPT
jgi:hypothetical protein